MRKTLVVGLVVGMVAGSLIGPAEAKKKKKKPKSPPPAAVPVDVNFYLRNESTACAEADLKLSVVDGDDNANCGSAFSGPGNEVLVRAGQEPETIVYTAADGLPFVLNAAKPITGMIGVGSFCCRTSNTGFPGPTTLVLKLTGSVGGETKDIATASVAYTAAPTPSVQEVKFEMKVDAALDRAQVASMQLALHNQGVAPLHGFYMTDDPASFFTISTLQPPPA